MSNRQSSDSTIRSTQSLFESLSFETLRGPQTLEGRAPQSLERQNAQGCTSSESVCGISRILGPRFLEDYACGNGLYAVRLDD